MDPFPEHGLNKIVDENQKKEKQCKKKRSCIQQDPPDSPYSFNRTHEMQNENAMPGRIARSSGFNSL